MVLAMLLFGVEITLAWFTLNITQVEVFVVGMVLDQHPPGLYVAVGRGWRAVIECSECPKTFKVLNKS